MSKMLPWLLLDVGNTAIKWRLAQAEGLLDQGGRTASDPQALCEALTGLAWSQAALSSVAGPSFDGEVIARLSEISDAPVSARRCSGITFWADQCLSALQNPSVLTGGLRC